MTFELNSDDVVSMSENQMVNHSTAKIKEIESVIVKHTDNVLRQWMTSGASCEILQVQGGGWVSGTIKIKTTIEFTPDEPADAEISSLPLNTDSVSDWSSYS